MRTASIASILTLTGCVLAPTEQGVMGGAPDLDGVADTGLPADGPQPGDVPGDDRVADDPPADDPVTDDPATPASCADDLDYFTTTAWPQVFESTCAGCHATPVANATRLALDLGADAQVNLDAVWAVAALTDADGPLLLSKPTNTHSAGHGGGEQVAAGSAAYAVLEQVVQRATGSCPPPPVPDTGDPAVADSGDDTGETDVVDTGETDVVDTGETDVVDTIYVADTYVDDTGYADTGSCRDDRDYFRDEVWEPILTGRCVSCHLPGGFAATTRLVVDVNDVEGGYQAAASLARISTSAGSLFVAKPTGTAPSGHGGGAQVALGSAEHDALLAFAARARGTHPCSDAAQGIGVDTGDPVDPDPPRDTALPVDPQCGDVAPLPRRLRRLTPVEFDRTIEALLGVPSRYGESFSSDVIVDGYRNNADVLDVSPLLAEQVATAVETLVFDDLGTIEDVLPCDPDVVGARDCASQFVVDFGRRAWRRPLEQVEHDRYLDFWDEVDVEEGFEAGIRWTMAALLQSPNFLYRAELGVRGADGFTLTDHEIASELSYLVWSSMPDDELLDLADEGRLSDPAVRRAQIQRMLQDPRADGVMWRFTQAWLKLDQLPFVTRDPAVYPDLSQSIRDDMLRETSRFVERTFRDGGTLSDLLLGQTSWLNTDLAAYYDVPAGSGPTDPAGFRNTDLSTSPYGGLLTQGSLLTTHANPGDSSPVHRGILVRERLLCQHLPPPPANLDISPPEVDPNATTRERFEQHRADPACSGCHELIDPIGYGFEHFDGAARYRADENGLPLDVSGYITSFDGGSTATFDGLDELASLLANSEMVQSCYVEQWATFALGGLHEDERDCRVAHLDAAVAATGGELSAAVVALVDDPAFARRTGAAGELDAPGYANPAVAVDDVPDQTDPQVDTGDPGSTDTGGPVWSGDLDVDVEITNDWGGGYCTNITVMNHTADPVVWQIDIDHEGAVYNIWNAEEVMTAEGPGFQGLSWNREVWPGGNVGFGFCANR